MINSRMLLLAAIAALPLALAAPILAHSFLSPTPALAALAQPVAGNGAAPQAPLGNMVLASNEYDNAGGPLSGRSGDDDRSEQAVCGGEEDDLLGSGQTCTAGAALAPAPAGSVAPPANGLFATGSGPVVQVQ